MDRDSGWEFIERNERVEWGLHSRVQSEVQEGGSSFSREVEGDPCGEGQSLIVSLSLCSLKPLQGEFHKEA